MHSQVLSRRVHYAAHLLAPALHRKSSYTNQGRGDNCHVDWQCTFARFARLQIEATTR